MTDKERKRQSAVVKSMVRKFHKKEGVRGVQERLARVGIERTMGRLEQVASIMKVIRRDPKVAETVRRVMESNYNKLGAKATARLLGEKHDIKVTPGYIANVASQLTVRSGTANHAKADENAAAQEKAEREKQKVVDFRDRLLRPLLVKMRRVRNKQADELLGGNKKDESRGMLQKLVELGDLVRLNDIANGCVWYLDADTGFYKNGELMSLVPEAELGRIAKLAFEIIKGGGTHSVVKLASEILPDQAADGIIRRILPKLLEKYIELDIITITPSGYYKKGFLADFTPEFVRMLRMAGQITMKRLEEKRYEFKTPEDIIAARRESMKKLLVRPFDLSPVVKPQGPLNILFATGMPEGHILAGEEFLNGCLKNIEAHPELGPDIVVANDFVQGNFLFEDIMNGLMLDDFAGLDSIDRQIEAASVWLQYMQGLPKNKLLLINESVDEKRTGKGYAISNMLKGQQWYKVFGLNLSVERQRAVKNKFLFYLIKLQTEVVITYWIRIGRAPYNEAQMDEVARKRKLEPLGENEYFALVNIYWAETFSDKHMLAGLSPDERKKTEQVVAEIKKKYAGWIHRTPPPKNVNPGSQEFARQQAKYSGPVNLHALMAEEEKKLTA